MINLDIIVEALEMTDNETEFFIMFPWDRTTNDNIMVNMV